MSRRTPQILAALTRSAPPIAALSALALAQPLLDLFGRNPEFFVAQDAGASGVIVFGLAVAVGLPLVLVALVVGAAAVSEGPARIVHGVVLALLGAALALVAVGRDQTVAVALLSAGALALIVVVAESRYEWLRSVLRHLSPLPLVVLALFVFASETSRLVWAPDAAAAPAEVVADPAPVSLLIFDELPVASLMRADGTINADRFPNFARLADSGTWYRNATTAYPRTEVAVPALLSGTTPDLGQIPSTIDYPRNIFTLLADSHAMNVQEEVTALCPAYACVPAVTPPSTVDRTVDSLHDAALVFAHRALPSSLREGLPPVNQSWGGFGGEADDPFGARRDDPAGTQTQVGKLAYFDQMIDRIADGPQPMLNVAHGVFPHAPWTLTPSGAAYGSVTEGFSFEPWELWSDDEEVVRQGQIQHLLQLGQADAVLGRLIDRLEATGQWEESLVAVVGDHGIAFEPGTFAREATADNRDEVFRVPFLVKLPDQGGGAVEDAPVQTIDLLPTIVDALGVETDWTFEGRSLVGGADPDRRPVAYLRDGSEIDLDPSVEPLLALARRNHRRFPHGDDWLGLVAVGPLGAEVGRPVADLELGDGEGWTWTTDRAGAFDEVGDGFVPIQFDGRVEGPAATPDPAGFLVAVNGTVAGVGVDITADGPGAWTFTTIVAEELFVPGENIVTLYAPDPAGGTGHVPVAGELDPLTTVETGADGEPTTVRRDGEPLALVPADHRQVVVESAFTDGQTVVVEGWAGDTDLDRRPVDIVLLVDGERVNDGVAPHPTGIDPSAEVEHWGFRVTAQATTVGAATNGILVAVFEDGAVALAVDWA